jgi:DNA-binding NtrC family response regulator
LRVPVLSRCGQIRLSERETKHTGPDRAESSSVMRLSSPKGSLVILVADSDVFARNFLIRELSREGYFVLGAASSEEAVVLSRTYTERIHLLLSNFDRRRRRTLTESIVRDRPEIQVITISASIHADLIERSRVRGASPGQRTGLPETLNSAIRRALMAAKFSDAAEV